MGKGGRIIILEPLLQVRCMAGKSIVLIAVALLLCFPLSVGCTFGEDTTPDRVEGEGTIEWFDAQGGFYGIVADDGSSYRPTSLDREFEQEGLRVAFRGTKQNLAALSWDNIELTYIERL